MSNFPLIAEHLKYLHGSDRKTFIELANKNTLDFLQKRSKFAAECLLSNITFTFARHSDN